MKSDEDSDSDSDSDDYQDIDFSEPVEKEVKDNSNSDSDSDSDSEDENEKHSKVTLSSKPLPTPTSTPSNDEDVIEEGRLFIRDLPYSCKEEEISAYVSQYGEIADLFIPLNAKRESKGYCFVTFMFPEQAIQALPVIFTCLSLSIEIGS